MTFDLMRFGIANDWIFGKTPYNEEFNENLNILNRSQAAMMVNYYRNPPLVPNYQLPPNAPYSKVNTATKKIEYWKWVYDIEMDSFFEVLDYVRDPIEGMVIGVLGDRRFMIFGNGVWRFKDEFRQPGYMSVTADVTNIRPGRTAFAMFVTDEVRIDGSTGSKCFPLQNKIPYMITEFSLRKNGSEFGVVKIPGPKHSMMSSTIEVSPTRFEPGDQLSMRAPFSLHGIVDITVTLRFTGII